ncbi:MAG TPA: hypothetical protein VFF43_16065, partial [Caldimonas sp.]|nr:hypothetical protein [Caldimonas sp.]
PLLKRVMERQRSRGRAVPLGRVPAYAYARLIKAYAGSPIAPALSRIIEEMWDSPILTRRSKLLMLAVIARGLNCDACAGEIGEALQREGFDDAALHQILTHLDAPELDDVERLLVRFARETIWYEPARIQRRARALKEQLRELQLVEAIGVAALGNGLCRMGAILGCAQ